MSFRVQVLSPKNLRRTIERADNVFELARRFAPARWQNRTGDELYCLSCEEIVRLKNFGGFAIGRFDDESSSYAAAFCDGCKHKEPKVLSQIFLLKCFNPGTFECTLQ